MNDKRSEETKEYILIVDDIPQTLRLLSSLLERQGYKVECVTDGEKALQKIHTHPPDLILLDVLIPVIDGYKVCQIIKTNKKTSHIPVIFISGLDAEYDRVQAFKIGAVDYITKPFFPEELVVRIETQLKIQKKQRFLQQFIQEQIAQRENLETQLNDSRALLNGVLNTSLDGVAVFEVVRDDLGNIKDFRWLIANPVAAMTVGETSKSLIGTSLRENLSGHFFESLFDAFVQVVENCIVLEKEYFYNSESFQGWLQIVAVKLGDGFAMTFRDITEYKQMELALKQANQELEHQANIDSLTQIANRRFFDKYILQEWARCGRQNQYLSLILGDVDYFKAYNDAYGHQTGDKCLLQVAQAMNSVIKRPADLVFRYGGEEFAIVLPATNREGALRVAEEIKQKIKQLKITHHFSSVGDYVTISLGTASRVPNAESAPEALIAAADRALYKAKAQGRDRVVAASIELPLS
jgi:diguanylate cyclase (GGDEF)-like protein